MSDVLKEFIQKNREEFMELPSDNLWKKIDATLKQETTPDSYQDKSKNKSTMLKYGFGASLIIAGTFSVMNLQKEKTELTQTNNRNKEMRIEIPASSETFATEALVTSSKNNNKEQVIQNSSNIVFKESVDTIREITTPVVEIPILHGSRVAVTDTLDITTWTSAGNQRKKYSLSGDNASGKTIGCIKSVSKKINGFITLMQSSVPDKCLGKRIRMTGYIRTENVVEWAGLWLRVGIKGGDEALAFDNMRYGKKDRSIKGTTPRTKYEIVLDIPSNSANIIYGVMLVGAGQIYFDSFTLEVVDDSVPVTADKAELYPGVFKSDRFKSYHPSDFWRWYVPGRTISKDGTSNVKLEPKNF